MTTKLPDVCYSTLGTTGETIILSNGEKGYWRCADQRSADVLNELIGVTKAQEAAMKFGSMYGFDVPGANPDNYDDNGKVVK